MESIARFLRAFALRTGTLLGPAARATLGGFAAIPRVGVRNDVDAPFAQLSRSEAHLFLRCGRTKISTLECGRATTLRGYPKTGANNLYGMSWLLKPLDWLG